MRLQRSLFTLILTFIAVCHCNPLDTDVGRKIDHIWTYNPEDYPNPKEDHKKCKQQTPSTICDPDGILGIEEAARLKDLIERLQNKSPCLCKEGCAENAHEKGLVVGVALLENMYTPYSTNSEDLAKNINNMATKIKEKWNLGSCGNDILIFVVTDQKTGSILPGDNVKEVLSEEVINEIVDECKGHVNSGHYYEFIQSVINSLYDEVSRSVLKAPGVNGDGNDTATNNAGLTIGIVLGIACLCGLAAGGFVINRRRKRNNQNGFMYDGVSGRKGSKHEPISPIVKQHIVFPDSVYKPCSVEDDDAKKSVRIESTVVSDEENDDENNEDFYLNNLEENPVYDSADMVRLPLNVENRKPKNDSTEQPVAVHQNNNNITPNQPRDEKMNDLSV